MGSVIDQEASEIHLPPDFGERVRAARRYLNLSQADFAERLRMGTTYVKNVEKNKGLKDLEKRGLLDRLVELTNLPESFFTGDERPLLERVSELESQVQLLRAETAARDAEVLKQIAALRLPIQGPQSGQQP